LGDGQRLLWEITSYGKAIPFDDRIAMVLLDKELIGTLRKMITWGKVKGDERGEAGAEEGMARTG